MGQSPEDRCIEEVLVDELMGAYSAWIAAHVGESSMSDVLQALSFFTGMAITRVYGVSAETTPLPPWEHFEVMAMRVLRTALNSGREYWLEQAASTPPQGEGEHGPTADH